MEDGSAVHTMSGNAETRDLKRTDWNPRSSVGKIDIFLSTWAALGILLPHYSWSATGSIGSQGPHAVYLSILMEDGSAVHTMSGNAETRDLKRTDWNRMAQAPFVGLKARARSTGSESGHGCGAVRWSPVRRVYGER